MDVTGWMAPADLELKRLYKTDCSSISQKAGLKRKAWLDMYCRLVQLSWVRHDGFKDRQGHALWNALCGSVAQIYEGRVWISNMNECILKVFNI